jgi:CRP-like cAMP-binding protein
MAGAMSRDVIKGCLQALPPFSELSAGELETLGSGARSMTLKKGARVFEEGSQADCCLVLTTGRAKVVLSGDKGSDILLRIIKAVSLVGEVALLDGSTRSASLVTLEDSHFIRIPAPLFEQLRRNPAFERRMVARVASMLRDASDQVRGISTFPAMSRVAWCLGRIARQEGRVEGATVVIPKLAHHELAEMTGCSRETVSRALATLKRKKYVTWDEHSVRLEMGGLRRLLGGEFETAAHWGYTMGSLGRS